METSMDKLRVLEVLAEELLKDDPEESLVRKYMNEAGLPDSQDPVDRINKVLMALHFEAESKDFKE